MEAVYEGSFATTSHSFRALSQVQTCLTGVKWFVEGDIKGFFDNINHEVMIGILAERIKDEKFLRLTRKFLKSGYLEDWQYHNTYSGTPQGGIISPILANIYLDKLDRYMEELKKRFDKGAKRAVYPETYELEKKRGVLAKKLRSTDSEEERLVLTQKIREIDRKKLLEYGAMTIEKTVYGKDNWKAKAHYYLKDNDDLGFTVPMASRNTSRLRERRTKFF